MLGKTSVASGFAVGEMLPSGAPFRGSPLPSPSGVPADTHRTCGAPWWPRCLPRPPSPRTHSSARLPPGPRSAPGGPGSPAGMGGCGPGSHAPGPGARSPAAGLRPGGGGPQSGLPVGREGLSAGAAWPALPLCPAVISLFLSPPSGLALIPGPHGVVSPILVPHSPSCSAPVSPPLSACSSASYPLLLFFFL